MVVDRVDVTAGRVRLPDLDQRVAHRPAVGIRHTAADDDALPQRLARVLSREVCVLGLHLDAPERGSARVVEPLVGQLDGPMRRRAQLRRSVVGMEVGRLVLDVAHGPLTAIMNRRKLR